MLGAAATPRRPRRKRRKTARRGLKTLKLLHSDILSEMPTGLPISGRADISLRMQLRPNLAIWSTLRLRSWSLEAFLPGFFRRGARSKGSASRPDQDAPRGRAWRSLSKELDQWRAQGLTARLWWRDDDLVRPTPRLDRLLDVARRCNCPVALAVIPARVSDGLGQALAGTPTTVVQHGFAHIDHASSGRRKESSELGAHRPQAVILDELVSGREQLGALFGDRFLPVLVPPWNRIDRALLPALSASGFCGVSTFGPRGRAIPTEGLVEINAHFEPIRWRGGPHFAGAASVLSALVSELRARRTGAADPQEPIGLLTHHANMDDRSWTLVEHLITFTASHAAAEWLSPEEIFKAGPRAPQDSV